MTDLLAIETSAESCSVALQYRGEIREFFEHAPMRHAELLLPAIRGLLGDAGLQPGALDAIAFGRGPGSFTSLRIGIGVVQGLAWGADLPVVPISSLAAVAQLAAEESASGARTVVVAMDARMQEVFTAPFTWRGEGMVEPQAAERVCAASRVDAPADVPFIAAGNGFERFEELKQLASKSAECRPDLWPRAAVICRLASAWLEEHQPLPPALAQPVYVRNEVAVKPKTTPTPQGRVE